MCIQNPGCGEATSALNVTIPTDVITHMTAEATDRGVTVAQLVEEAFSRVGNRICPALSID